MATVVETKTTPGEQRFLLNNIAWETYCALVNDPGIAGVRLTYDRGALELMSPSSRHEKFKGLIGRFIELFTMELEIPIVSCGSTTYARELLQRGLEPDESYYVQHEPEIRNKDDLDLDHDPPPDLVIEVEITTSMLNKLDVYAALKVPEIWRFNGKTLKSLLLNKDGRYDERETSSTFPLLPLGTLVEWIERRTTTDETSLMRDFQQWVRENIPDERPA